MSSSIRFSATEQKCGGRNEDRESALTRSREDEEERKVERRQRRPSLPEDLPVARRDSRVSRGSEVAMVAPDGWLVGTKVTSEWREFGAPIDKRR